MNDKALKTKNIFGKSLKRALKRAGFTQGELANDLHGEVYTEKTNIKRKREGRKIITEYRHEKESLGNIFEK
jgi:hypothetical protein